MVGQMQQTLIDPSGAELGIYLPREINRSLTFMRNYLNYPRYLSVKK